MKNMNCLLLLLLSFTVSASDLKISEPVLYNDHGQAYALLNLSWKNAWNNDTNKDAVWLFFKFLRGDNGYLHVKPAESGHQVAVIHEGEKAALNFEVPEDGAGIFISVKNRYRGNLHVTVKIILDPGSYKGANTTGTRFSAYAIEMVQIPGGGFFVGDIDTVANRFGGLYKSDANGNHNGLFKINSETQSIQVSPDNDNLFYKAPSKFEGDQRGIIPEIFPKAVKAFYIMKYEPTQGQYADFLNSLSENQSQNRVIFGGKNYYSERGSIKMNEGKYYAAVPNAPCNFMSWDDATAYADWAGLRPMTEFEFTKASRGTLSPVANAFPWGTSSKEKLQRMVGKTGELIMLNNWDESMLTNETKEYFGASYYWVMDLAGSLWERVISIGHEKGRAFKGTEGDGKLTYYGFATNEDWPKGNEETGGFGFRGGGFYGYGRDYNDFNPFSPTAYRTFGAWSGGNRVNAYGARFVKSIQ